MSTSKNSKKVAIASPKTAPVRAARPSRSKAAIAARQAANANAAMPEASVPRTVAATVTSAIPIKDVFNANPEQVHEVNVPVNSVALYVNGSSQGIVDTNGKTLETFVREVVNRAGIRTFSVYLDGARALTNQGNMSLAGVAKMEIVSKDTRG
jgi:hypothetical protein